MSSRPKRTGAADTAPVFLIEVAPMARIAWLGLGTMGFPMAGNLSQRGAGTRWRSLEHFEPGAE
jgi:hypothetical protein